VSVREGIAGRTYQCCHTARRNDARFSTYLLHVQHYTMHRIRYKTCRNKMLICSCGVPPKSCSRVTRLHACHWFAIPVLDDRTLHLFISSDTSVDFSRTSRRYISEDRTVHNHRPEKLRSYIICSLHLIRVLIGCKMRWSDNIGSKVR
jgi:hypothetical protein